MWPPGRARTVRASLGEQTFAWSEEDPSKQLQNRGTRAGGHRDFPVWPTCFIKTQAEDGTSLGLLIEEMAKPRPVPGALSSSQSSFLSLSLGFC